MMSQGGRQRDLGATYGLGDGGPSSIDQRKVVDAGERGEYNLAIVADRYLHHR